MAMAFEMPGADVVGFEHSATTARDRAAVDAALAVLSGPLTLFVPPDAAGCAVSEAGAELHEDGGHTEFRAEYLLTCADPGALDRIGFAVFDAFPGAREIGVQVVAQGGARAFEVGRDDPVLDLGGGL